MIELLEYLTEEEALKDRADKSAQFIRRFFADAGMNRVQAFNDRSRNCAGWIFFQNTGENAGRYFMFVTAQINPNPDEAERWKRQFTNFEWFTGPSAEIVGTPAET